MAGFVDRPVYILNPDTSSANTGDACTELPASTPDLSKYIVVIKRGSCNFAVKCKFGSAVMSKVLADLVSTRRRQRRGQGSSARLHLQQRWFPYVSLLCTPRSRADAISIIRQLTTSPIPRSTASSRPPSSSPTSVRNSSHSLVPPPSFPPTTRLSSPFLKRREARCPDSLRTAPTGSSTALRLSCRLLEEVSFRCGRSMAGDSLLPAGLPWLALPSQARSVPFSRVPLLETGS